MTRTKANQRLTSSCKQEDHKGRKPIRGLLLRKRDVKRKSKPSERLFCQTTGAQRDRNILAVSTRLFLTSLESRRVLQANVKMINHVIDPRLISIK